MESIQDDFYKTVSGEKLEEASLKGIVDSLGDRFSHYFTPNEAKQFDADPERLVRGRGHDGRPATQARPQGGVGVRRLAGEEGRASRKGDVITAVNGSSIAGQAADIATSKIKGPAGTSVRAHGRPARARPPRRR